MRVPAIVLLSVGLRRKVRRMGLPNEPVTLQPDRVSDLNQRLSTLRHNVNNHLSLMLAAIELIKRKPELAPRMIDNISDQPMKIVEELKIFSDALEEELRITR